MELGLQRVVSLHVDAENGTQVLRKSSLRSQLPGHLSSLLSMSFYVWNLHATKDRKQTFSGH